MEDTISIILMPSQRDLLLKYESQFTDPYLFRLISTAVKKGNRYKICLNVMEMTDLMNLIFDLSDNEENEELIDKLDDLHDYLYEIYGGDDEKMDAQDKRIMEIVGNPKNAEFDESINAFYKYLKANLLFPCKVTGVEDFRWEEYYLLGGGDKAEYEQLKKQRPSYRDRYQLLNIYQSGDSEWEMGNGDLAASVRRISDKKEFVLGLSELKATDKKSKNYELLDDYSVWFVNSA